MSLWKKTLASLGIGATKVDVSIKQPALYPGQSVEIQAHVYGGSTEQVIEQLSIRLCCQYWQDIDPNRDEPGSNVGKREAVTYTLAESHLPESFSVASGEEKVFALTLSLPWETPITLSDAKVWLDTSLDIAYALDPRNKASITVRPDPVLDEVLSLFEEQGFRIRQVECEAVDGLAVPFVEEFEFVPVDGPFHGVWRELEVAIHRNDQSMTLWMAIDRHRDGLRGMLASVLNRNETFPPLVLDVTASREQLKSALMRYLESMD